jgi:pyruvate dehydrogenase E1 component
MRRMQLRQTYRTADRDSGKTIKGYGMGEAGEAQNITHQQKKMGTTSLKAFRNRFGLDIPDDKIDEVPYLTFR